MTESPGIDLKPPLSRRRRWRRWLVFAAIFFLVALIAAELYARLYWGLGDPPLLMDDPQIEYLYKPSHTYHRFGNTISINSHSMRSDEFPTHKKTSNEFRVMVLGDSVVYGGARLDQPDLATEVLKRRLSEQMQRPVVVGNIAAGSWGPSNQLAYAKRFGLFDADVVIIVLNSGDCGDVPAPMPRTPITPQTKPWLAIQEALVDNGASVARFYLSSDPQPPSAPPSKEDIEQSLFDLKQLVDLANSSGARTAIAMWMTYDEITAAKTDPGYATLRSVALGRGVPVIEIGPAIAKTLHEQKTPFRDHMHPSPLGQEVMADEFFKWITQPAPPKN